MNYFIRPFLILSSMVLLSGCVVSKKKYEALSSAKKRSDMRVRELSSENRELSQKLESKTKESKKLSSQLDQLKKEYNSIKNQMLENNAKKTTLIEDLNRKLSSLNTDKSALRDSLESVINRLSKQEVKTKDKEQELQKQLDELGGIEEALKNYRIKLADLEQFIVHNFDKNNISGAYTETEKGFLIVTFDPNILFKKKNELSNEGKRVLKIIAAACNDQSPVIAKVGGNWNESIEDDKARESLNEKAAAIISYMNESYENDDIDYGVHYAKVEIQKAAEDNVNAALILYPPLQSLSQFAN